MQKFLARQPLEIYLMKKSLLALAVLGAFAGAAQAQTGVTVYGSFDAGLRHQSNTNTTGDSNTTMNSKGTYSSNRIGFKGVEDLGGGLNAHFTLETGFETGTGALDNTTNQLFQRQAFVGLGGAWGAVDMGRQYTITYQTASAYDPFNYKFSSIIPASTLGTSNRVNNDIKYTGKFGPITAQAEYALGETAGSTSSKSTRAIGGSYAGGPFSIGAAYTQQPDQGGANLDAKDWTIGGAFATGPFRVAAGYNNYKIDTSATATAKTKDWWLGGSYALTPAAALTAGYYETKVTTATSRKRKLFIVGATYALSKRTNFYADIDNRRYNGDTGVAIKSAGKGNDSQTGVSVGINHMF
jgi:predicted porin